MQVPAQITTGWRGYKINGGGVVLDWAVHLVDQLMLRKKLKIPVVRDIIKNAVSWAARTNKRLSLKSPTSTISPEE